MCDSMSSLLRTNIFKPVLVNAMPAWEKKEFPREVRDGVVGVCSCSSVYFRRADLKCAQQHFFPLGREERSAPFTSHPPSSARFHQPGGTTTTLSDGQPARCIQGQVAMATRLQHVLRGVACCHRRPPRFLAA